MRPILLAAALVLAFAIVPVAAADDDGPEPTSCRPYCLDMPAPDDLLPRETGPEPSGCRPLC